MEVTSKIITATFETFFKKPLLHKDARLDEFAQKCLELFGGYGLMASNIELKVKDVAYHYELAFKLFNNNAGFRITSEKFELSFQNATNQSDYEVVGDCITKVYCGLPLPAINNTNIVITSQAVGASSDFAQKYLQQNAALMKWGKPENQVSKAGFVVYVKCKDWPDEIRLMVDRSLIMPEEGLFFAWHTTLKEQKLTRENLLLLSKACNEASDKLDLVFPREEK